MSMPAPAPERSEPPVGSPLEDHLAAVEAQLSALGEALRARDVQGIDAHATELHCALARAVDHFARAASNGPIPPALRHRLAAASGQVAAQRNSLARATAALDRAIDVLIPREDGAAVYSTSGAAERGGRGVLQA